MSRHTITEGSVEAVIGWDPPLQTYFAQVWDRSRDEDDPAAELLWIGCTPAEMTDPRSVCDKVTRWVQIPAGLAETLLADAEAGV